MSFFDSWGRGERRLWGCRCGALFCFVGHVPAGEVPACAPFLPFNAHTVESLLCFIFQPGFSWAQTQTKRVQDRVTQELQTQTFKTFNNGSLGSRIDEERSELRYVMRIAASVKHRIFERTLCAPWHSRGHACLSVVSLLSASWLWAAPVWLTDGSA